MTAATLELVPVGAIVASPDQNRTEFDPVKLGELAQSIAESGLLQPVRCVVRHSVSLSGTTEPTYTLIAGERRLRAVRDLLGWATIPVVIVDDSETDADRAFATLAENMIRDDPGPLEQARGLAIVADKHGLTAAELAQRLGKGPRWVKDRLSLLELAPDVAHYVQTGALPIGRGVIMSGLDANRQRLALQAHEHGIGPDAFRALVGKLEADQAEDSMFDPDDFMRVETWWAEAENAVAKPEVSYVREPPLGIAEIAELLEVKPQTVHQWRARGIFPDPDLKISGSPVWWEGTVTDWAVSTGRC